MASPIDESPPILITESDLDEEVFTHTDEIEEAEKIVVKVNNNNTCTTSTHFDTHPTSEIINKSTVTTLPHTQFTHPVHINTPNRITPHSNIYNKATSSRLNIDYNNTHTPNTVNSNTHTHTNSNTHTTINSETHTHNTPNSSTPSETSVSNNTSFSEEEQSSQPEQIDNQEGAHLNEDDSISNLHTPNQPTVETVSNTASPTHDDQEQINTSSLGETSPTPSRQTPTNNSNFECNICLDDVTDPVVTLCGHLFCWDCLLKCLERGITKCPVCKSSISESNIIPLYGRGQDSSTRRARTIVKRPPAQRTESSPIYRPANIISGWTFSFEFFGLGSALDTNSDMIANRTYPIYHRLQARVGDRQPDVQFQHIPILFLVIGLSIAFYLLTT